MNYTNINAFNANNPDFTSSTTQKKTTVPFNPQEDKAVKELLARWKPKAIDNSFLGIQDEKAMKKPAKDFLADPTKVGMLDFITNTALWVGVPHLAFDGLHFIVDKIPTKTVEQLPKFLSEGATFLKTNGSHMGKLMMIEGAIAALIQIPLSLGVWNNQKTTNEKVLKTLKEQGIDAPLGDTLHK